MSGVRNFWLIRDVRKNSYEACTIKPKWNEMRLGDERIHVIAKQDLQPFVDKLKHMNFEIYEEVQEFLKAWEGNNATVD